LRKRKWPIKKGKERKTERNVKRLMGCEEGMKRKSRNWESSRYRMKVKRANMLKGIYYSTV
jgi:hypothetical protein